MAMVMGMRWNNQKNQKSGLKHALDVLHGVKGISFMEFDESDVIRHKLVKKIIKAYKEED